MKGFLSFILHAHLPYVKHLKYDNAIEERWFYQVLTECYIPLLIQLKRLAREGICSKFTISISPPLLEMMSDEILKSRYIKYLNSLIQLLKLEEKVKEKRDYIDLVKFYLAKIKEIKKIYLSYNTDLLSEFNKLKKSNQINLITTTATHAYLPLLNQYPTAIKAQIKQGVKTYQKYFATTPDGLWLPECAYYPGLDKILKEFELKYFFIDSHGLLTAVPRPKYGVYAPAYTKTAIAAFARDPAASKQVWSRDEGYPGHPLYREFHCDLSQKLNFKLVKKYIHPEGVRADTGIKYYRITDKNSQDKEIYQPLLAKRQVKKDARDFINKRKKQVNNLAKKFERYPIITAPYDAELFGHWWYEGPSFLYHLAKELDKTAELKLITPDRYLSLEPRNQICELKLSSWGENGYSDVWLNEKNSWIYKGVLEVTKKMITVASKNKERSNLERRALNQATRELLLAQSSDWQFIITTETTVEYATRRVNNHIDNFNQLIKQIKNKTIDIIWLKEIEEENSIFADLDYKLYSSEF